MFQIHVFAYGQQTGMFSNQERSLLLAKGLRAKHAKPCDFTSDGKSFRRGRNVGEVTGEDTDGEDIVVSRASLG